LPGKVPIRGLPGAKRRDAKAAGCSAPDWELSRRQDARRVGGRPGRSSRRGHRGYMTAGTFWRRVRANGAAAAARAVRPNAQAAGLGRRPPAARLPTSPSGLRRGASSSHREGRKSGRRSADPRPCQHGVYSGAALRRRLRYTGRFGNRPHTPTPMPPTAYVACAALHRKERHGPLSAAHAEPNDLRKLSAVTDISAQRAESAICVLGAPIVPAAARGVVLTPNSA
jgi:hypothetical protein